MALGSIAPVGIQQFFDGNGAPLAGGRLAFYLAGSSTPSPAYADVGLTVALPNPLTLDGAGRAPELFLGALTYKFVLTDAAGVLVWTADQIVTPAALRSVGSSISLTGVQHDVPVPQGVITFLDCRNTAPLYMTGFAGGTPGQILIIRALGTGPIFLTPAAFSGSQPQNQLINFVQSGPTPLAGINSAAGGGGTAVYVKAGDSYWILIAHEQGAWITPTYSAANFVALGADWLPHAGMTWTVEAGDVLTAAYRLSGMSLTIAFCIENTSVAGGPSFLSLQNWPYVINTTMHNLPVSVFNAGGFPVELGVFEALNGRTDVQIARTNFAPWGDATNNTNVAGQITVDVG